MAQMLFTATRAVRGWSGLVSQLARSSLLAVSFAGLSGGRNAGVPGVTVCLGDA